MVLYPYLKLIQIKGKRTHSGKRRKKTYIWVAWKIKVILVESDLCRSSSPALCWAQCQHWVQVCSLSVLSTWVLRFNSFVAIPVPIFYFSCSWFFPLICIWPAAPLFSLLLLSPATYITEEPCSVAQASSSGTGRFFTSKNQNVGRSLKPFCACGFFSLVVENCFLLLNLWDL